jgi:PLP dependent protein
VLMEVNVGGEASKRGVAPAQLADFLAGLAGLANLRVEGLMTIPPPGDAEASRAAFRRLRQLRDDLAGRTPPNVDLRQLSMGMTDDFEIAIEEGATLVRVGRAIFGARE